MWNWRFFFGIIILVCCFSCLEEKGDYLLNPIDKSTLDLSKSHPYWRFCSDSINVYIWGESSAFVTDVPSPYLVFWNIFTDQAFAFYNLGSFHVEGNNVYLLSGDMGMQHSLYGWFKKNNTNEFCDPQKSQKLVYENNLLYTKDSQVMTVYQAITNLDGFQTPKNLKFEFLYKFDPEIQDVRVVSARKQDIFDASEGLYYIPYPGIYVDKILNIDALSKKVVKEPRFIDISF